jgi:hypothetical protein
MLQEVCEPGFAIPPNANAAVGIKPRLTNSFGQYSKQRAQAKQSPRSGS